MCICLEAFPTQRDHPNSRRWQAPLPVPVHLLIQSSSPRQQISLQRAQQTCERSPQLCQPMALSITTPFLLLSPFPPVSLLLCLCHGQPCPSCRQCPCMCPAHSHAVLPQNLIPFSLADSTRKEGSSATGDLPARPAPGIAQFSHHLQTLGERAIKHKQRQCVLRPQLQGGVSGAEGKVWRIS